MKSIFFTLIIFLTIAARKFTDEPAQVAETQAKSKISLDSFSLVHEAWWNKVFFYPDVKISHDFNFKISGSYLIKQKTPAYGPAFSSDGSGNY